MSKELLEYNRKVQNCEKRLSLRKWEKLNES